MLKMAREILFRGFNAESKQWIHGNLISGDYFFILSDIKESEEKIRFTYFKVIPDSVGQFIGLTDKNGVKVFEGDVIEANGIMGEDNIVKVKGYIMFDDSHASYVVKNKYGSSTNISFVAEYCRSDIEVIGNIFENPELLEPENKKAA